MASPAWVKMLRSPFMREKIADLPIAQHVLHHVPEHEVREIQRFLNGIEKSFVADDIEKSIINQLQHALAELAEKQVPITAGNVSSIMTKILAPLLKGKLLAEALFFQRLIVNSNGDFIPDALEMLYKRYVGAQKKAGRNFKDRQTWLRKTVDKNADALMQSYLGVAWREVLSGHMAARILNPSAFSDPAKATIDLLDEAIEFHIKLFKGDVDAAYRAMFPKTLSKKGAIKTKPDTSTLKKLDLDDAKPMSSGSLNVVQGEIGQAVVLKPQLARGVEAFKAAEKQYGKNLDSVAFYPNVRGDVTSTKLAREVDKALETTDGVLVVRLKKPKGAEVALEVGETKIIQENASVIVKQIQRRFNEPVAGAIHQFHYENVVYVLKDPKTARWEAEVLKKDRTKRLVHSADDLEDDCILGVYDASFQVYAANDKLKVSNANIIKTGTLQPAKGIGADYKELRALASRKLILLNKAAEEL